ncbi:MAG: GNAT family N-acetyltransferase [Acidobacteria bacterium]|nr:GNAT family N-acetyltransferase [Acidobacteriota bacterium]MCI0723288.1 GNAT family N-acetyltransferase [Acidobacteriota bacterium]
MQTSREYNARLSALSVCPTLLPPAEIREGRYLARFAQSRQQIEAALQLRFEVFNLELGEGLESSFATGQDRDEFDDSCHHLIILDPREERVVGTYRLQTGEMASAARGFYSAREFDLSLLPKGVLENSVELGRACIAKDHRNTHVLFLLWKGIAAYVAHNQKRYLFGCCSLTSQDPCEGDRVFKYLKAKGHLHERFRVSPKSGLECICASQTEDYLCEEVMLPKLFKIYLRFGAKVCGPPAIDREFKTIDFFVIFDVDSMDHRTHSLLFGG